MNLTVIQTTLEIIERLYGKKLISQKFPWMTLKRSVSSREETRRGVFQLESGGMRRYLKQLKPTQFGDITAMVSLYRPGHMEWIELHQTKA